MSLPKDERPPPAATWLRAARSTRFRSSSRWCFASGLFVALPVILYQLWAFIVPGLTRRESRMAVPFVVSSMVLFTLGGLVAYFTLPQASGSSSGSRGPTFTP